MSEETPIVPAKKKRGRPRIHPVVEREPVTAKRFKMKVQPNWAEFDPQAEETPDRLRIPPHLIPEGLSLQWVTHSVMGQEMPQHRAQFERRGWTPVHQSDFDGQFDGMYLPKGAEGEINYEGLVLMARPKEITDQARRADKRRAYEQVARKEAEMRGGEIGVGLDAQHKSALRFNHINKSMERIAVPDED